MRIIVVGLNSQGLQRQQIAGNACVALVQSIQDVPTQDYDAVLICTANEHKFSIARFALTKKKHVLLEAPLWANSLGQMDELEQLAIKNNVVLYIAYNMRFVEQFIQTQYKVQQKHLGELYHCRLSYTANTEENCNGALIDLSPQLLNLLCFWFGPEIMQYNFNVVHKDRLGRQIIIADFNARCTMEIEANYYAADSTINLDLYGSRDNLHIQYAYHPSNLRDLLQLEYAYFQQLCQQMQSCTDCVIDKWIFAEIDRLSSEEMLLA